jgi:2-C-methyl-D-erythritol 2,4-cyclodiphosphate synthase
VRIGHGYDAHRLVEDRALILGGVEIPYDKGLLGHSDADVLLHALADAILGAAALGDIGHLFPDNDPTTEGIDSRIILKKAVETVSQAGYAVENCDITMIAQKPKLAPYLPQMRQNIAHDLGVDISCVSVKATTEEHMGFTGSGEGMSCHAVVLLK